ncbi:hypothetical protein [Caulobacter sp. FWC2]|uniref:hypothetical protein n=1 Tax=Caulobacter sp. FWC2 TaxID=69664 RepID=UPI000C157A42|nr:hypothetical protein [Caulobacter sp. FWC2]PIB91265.1 hypothetical protein CSW62_06560 [Caulobacter sp. FWC2]
MSRNDFAASMAFPIVATAVFATGPHSPWHWFFTALTLAFWIIWSVEGQADRVIKALIALRSKD